MRIDVCRDCGGRLISNGLPPANVDARLNCPACGLTYRVWETATALCGARRAAVLKCAIVALVAVRLHAFGQTIARTGRLWWHDVGGGGSYIFPSLRALRGNLLAQGRPGVYLAPVMYTASFYDNYHGLTPYCTVSAYGAAALRDALLAELAEGRFDDIAWEPLTWDHADILLKVSTFAVGQVSIRAVAG